MNWQNITHIPKVSELEIKTKYIIKKVYKEGNYKWTDIIVAFHNIIDDAIYAAELEMDDE